MKDVRVSEYRIQSSYSFNDQPVNLNHNFSKWIHSTIHNPEITLIIEIQSTITINNPDFIISFVVNLQQNKAKFLARQVCLISDKQILDSNKKKFLI